MIKFKQNVFARLVGPKGKARTRWVHVRPDATRIVFTNTKFTKPATQVEIVDIRMRPIAMLGIPGAINLNPDDDVVVMLGRSC